MKTLIAIPSKGRAEAALTSEWSKLLDSSYTVVWFVEPQDYESYRNAMPEAVLSVLEANDRGLWFAKLGILKYARENGYEIVFKVDDDVRGLAGKDRKVKRGKEAARIFEEAHDDCIWAFHKYPLVKAIGFPYSHQMFTVKKWAGINARLQSCYAVRVEDWDIDPEVEVFEDFWTSIRIIAQNGNTLRYGFMGMDCDVGKMAGGIQGIPDFSRDEKAKKAIAYMQRFYPIDARPVEGKKWSVEPSMRGKFFGGKGL